MVAPSYSATHAEILEACRQAHADAFINELSQGYNTMVGEGGVRLSGGQRQRIALARMFLKKPAILILDEAVSSVDSESERYIQDAIQVLMRGRTTLLIAHRLSSLLLADRVLVLENGKIVEHGGHQELLSRNGVYTRLFIEQFNAAPHPARPGVKQESDWAAVVA